ncbi:MAG TPA: hypothetical protein PLC48_02380 [Ferruginibacter sp.]|nr:hypothetical protein [Ferruginibacter sp.]
MNINRHNYENFFLLYVDNELSAAEKTAVDVFVMDNPDLKAELDMLSMTSLAPEQMSFPGKEQLFKNEFVTISQEQLLLHLDDELSPADKKILEAQLASDELLLAEWNYLQAVKLDPADKVSFPDKKSLYRYENDRVVTIRYWKWAVAAALLGAGLFVGISIVSKSDLNKETNTIATKTEANGKEKKPTPVNTIDTKDQGNQKSSLAANDTRKNVTVPSVSNTGVVQPKQKKTVTVTSRELNNDSKNVAVSNQQKPVIKETNNLPKPYFENINNQKSNENNSTAVHDSKEQMLKKNEPSNVDIAKLDPALSTGKPLTAPDVNILSEMPNSFAKTASLSISEPESNDNHILFINEEKVSRSKISGFIRKVKRIITRNANIKTGNGIKIAGFEIASK